VSKKYIGKNDKLLIIDDFLADGNALKSLLDIANQSGAETKGIGIVIEKGFLEGGKILRDEGYNLQSLAIVDSMEQNKIVFRD
jgi:xanthine phosphoribosyltransferase